MMSPDEFTPGPGEVPGSFPEVQSDSTRPQWDLDAEFEHMFRSLVPEEVTPQGSPSATPRVDRRRRRPRFVWLRRSAGFGVVIVAITGAVTGSVSVLGAMVSYGPLRQLASPTAHGLAGSWPLLVYGPWLVGCLSVLQAAGHRRSGRAGWIAVILFSVIAMAMCISHAPRTIVASATAGLPPFSALASFLLLSRQITLLRPSRAKLPRQRKH